MLQYLRSNALGASALTVAIVGTSLAVVGLPRNSVGTEQLRRGAVHTEDIDRGAVTAPKIGKSVLASSTALAWARVSGGVPPTDPEGSFATQNFRVRSKTQVFAFARGRYDVTCAASATVAVGLFVDGNPLDGSGNRSLSYTGTSQELSLFGATPGLIGPGLHELSAKFDCVGSNFTVAGIGGDGAFGVIALGHQPGTAVPTAKDERLTQRARIATRAGG